MLRSVDDWEGEQFAFNGAPAPQQPTSVAIDNGADGPTATIPDAHLLFTAQFARAGDSLLLHGEDGRSFVVQDYFATDDRARLLSPEGAALSPSVVAALAGPQAAGQYAQAGAAPPAATAVGRVVQADSDATIVRNGVVMAANTGDPILKGDVLQTVSGRIGVTFNDGSTLNLTANTRLVVNEFVYDPRGSANSQLLDLVQGSLTFISGEVAHSGNMSIGTPVATMGIRGTVGGVTTATDGTVRFYVSQSATGAVILDGQGRVIASVVQDGPMIIVRPAGPLQVLAEEVQKSPAQLALELAALQQILSTKAVGDQLIQQFFQQDPNNQNPQSTDKPLTQFQTYKIDLKFNSPIDDGNDDPALPLYTAIVTPLPVDDTDPTPIFIEIPPDLAPVNFAPSQQAANEDSTVVFSEANDNAISVFDADTDVLTVTLTASHGVLSLSGVAGLSFSAGDGSGDASMTFSGSQAAINAALDGMSFTPEADYNGSAEVLIKTSDGNSTTAETVVDVAIGAVNDAPVLDYFNLTVAEGGTTVFSTSDFHITDPDSSSFFFSVANVTGGVFQVLPDDQQLRLHGDFFDEEDSQIWVDAPTGGFTVADIAAGHVRFVHDGGNAAPTFTVWASDGTEQGAGAPISPTVDLTPVNDAPVVAQPNSPIMSYTEGQPATSIDAVLTLSDADSASLTGATVSIGAGFHSSEDVLGFAAQNGISGSYDAQTGVLTLSGVATVAAYQAALRSVTYSNTSDSPSTDTRTINYQVDDGAAANHASNVVTASVTVAAINEAPVLSLTAFVEDRFDSRAYNLNTGSVNWTTDWIENENGDYASSPTTGEIQVRADPAVIGGNFRLLLSDDDNEAGSADIVQRTADLSGASAATLTFDYRRDVPNGNNGDIVYVWASADGSNFTQIGQIDASGNGSFVDSEYQHVSLDISTYISALTTIRFSANDIVDNGDLFYIDNVKIAYSGTATFVEGGSGVPVASVGATIKDTDNTHMQSATITLTNRQAGDMLTVNGALPPGIVVSNYNASTGILTLTGASTLAEYAAALHQVGFSNTGDDPGSSDRTINVTVFDGNDNSNTATVTVHVTPVNDAPVITWSAAGSPDQLQQATSNGLALDSTDAVRGLATDGQLLYVNDNGGEIDVYTLAGAFVESNAVGNLAGGSNQMIFADGHLYARNGNTIYLISTEDWSSSVVDVPEDKGLLTSKDWMTYDLLSLPDGRVGVMGANENDPETPLDDTTTLRLYTVGPDGVTFLWSEDIVLQTAGAPGDNHGSASDGTYIYIVDYQINGYRSYSLATGELVYSSGDITDSGTGADLSNPTFITHNHVTGEYIIGSYETPAVLFSAGYSNAVSVDENTTAVTTITASDADAGTTLAYSIVGGADQALFNINPITGALAFNAAPDYEAPADQGADNIYDVTVQVSDGALTDTQAIVVTVTDVPAISWSVPANAATIAFDILDADEGYVEIAWGDGTTDDGGTSFSHGYGPDFEGNLIVSIDDETLAEYHVVAVPELDEGSNAYVAGTSADDLLIGNESAFSNTFDGQAGDDVMFATSGQDTFVFASGGEFDRVVGFDAGQDFIDATEFGVFNETVALAFLDDAVDTAQGLLFTQGGDSLLLQDVLLASISTSNFYGLGT